MAAKEGTKRRCSVKCCCCCYCASCCCVLLALGAAIAVIASSFEVPEVDVQSARLTGVSVAIASGATLHAEVSIRVDNPNGWPIKGSVEQLMVDIWSVDKQDADGGEAFYLGNASLPEPVVVETQSETTFDVSTDLAIAASSDSANLLARLSRDCGLLASTKETKLRFKIKDAIAKVVDVEVDLTGLDVEVEQVVPCE